MKGALVSALTAQHVPFDRSVFSAIIVNIYLHTRYQRRLDRGLPSILEPASPACVIWTTTRTGEELQIFWALQFSGLTDERHERKEVPKKDNVNGSGVVQGTQ
jgi:hypothetical protein